LPELVGRDAIEASARLAAPGCFATAMQLAVFPAAKAGLLDTSRPFLMHAVTGSSGSGNVPKPGTHHPHRNGNLWAYALDGHRHEAELAQALESIDVHAPVHLSPHSGPFSRGIHLSASLPLAEPLDAAVAHEVYADFFTGQPFVQVLAEGVPDLRSVVGSNSAQVRTSVRGSVLTVIVTLDNLLKGGAGQALQCLNLMLGLAETSGLSRSGMGVL
jgi:N-acetyl-gamma-glutamyl-phosphate reductase